MSRDTETSLRISGQLPAPVVNGRGDSFRKWKDFQLSRAHDLDLGSGHTAYRRVVHHSSTSTYMPNFIEIKKELFVDEQTDGQLRHTLLGRLTRVDLKIIAIKVVFMTLCHKVTGVRYIMYCEWCRQLSTCLFIFALRLMLVTSCSSSSSPSPTLTTRHITVS